jgi:hypothetical protein
MMISVAGKSSGQPKAERLSDKIEHMVLNSTSSGMWSVHLDDGSAILLHLGSHKSIQWLDVTIILHPAYKSKVRGLCNRWDNSKPKGTLICSSGESWMNNKMENVLNWSKSWLVEEEHNSCKGRYTPSRLSHPLNCAGKRPIGYKPQHAIKPKYRATCNVEVKEVAIPKAHPPKITLDPYIPSNYMYKDPYTPSASSNIDPSYNPPPKIPNYIEPSEKTLRDAKDFCTKLLKISGISEISSSSFSSKSLLSGWSDIMSRHVLICMKDIITTSSYVFCESTRRSLNSHYQYLTARPYPEMISKISTIQEQCGFDAKSCMNECSSHGECSETGCICSSPFSGQDCSIDLSTQASPPSISSDTEGWLWNAINDSKVAPNITLMDEPKKSVTPSSTIDVEKCSDCPSTPSVNTTVASQPCMDCDPEMSTMDSQSCMNCSSEISTRTTIVSDFTTTTNPNLFPTFSNISINSGIPKSLQYCNFSYIFCFIMASIFVFA